MPAEESNTMPAGRHPPGKTSQTRREFLKTVGLGAAAAAMPRLLRAAEAPPGGRARPNVVLVLTDDQGYGDLGCHGNPAIRTPSIDRLYSQSARLADFHVSPTCSPTRAALMTGRYCNRTGVWHTIMGRSLLRADEITMADVFKAGGYATGHFGKWHLGDSYPFSPRYRGFETVVRHGGGGVGQTPDYWGNDYFDDTYEQNGRFVKHTGYCTDVWFDEALKFIESSVRQNRPFFCYLPTNAPHGPYNVPDEYARPYRGRDNVPNANFYGMIANIDFNMARLMKQLDKLGIADDTILIFATDNGTSAGRGFNAGMRGGKGSEYDGGHRVPCFIRYAGGQIRAGLDVAPITAHVDLLPTLVELCGLRRPGNVVWDGLSLAPLLTGRKADWPDRVLITDSQRVENPVKWRKSAVMTDRWRLINGQELYDIKSDPGQKKDIAAAKPDIVKRLRDEYEKWWADVSRRFDEFCPLVIGSDKENPTRLTCMDWHGQQVPWDQGHVRAGQTGNGFWAVQVERAGKYEFELRRWPEEVNKPINAAIAGGKAIRATKARLKIAHVDQTRPIAPQDASATFTVELKAGQARLETFLADDAGQSRGAYYVYVKRLT
jgi:arylsulfatase B